MTVIKKILLAAIGLAVIGSAKPGLYAQNMENPPIPISFTLESPGYVTLVIEKPDGFRVRNLISETWYPAGKNTAWWDGLDDLGRDTDAADHGVYHIPGKFVEPGNYRIRGLVRGDIVPKYEFSPYTTGNPPWNTADHTGAWLANHSQPMAAVFVPAHQSPAKEPSVLLGAYVTEGPDGLAWVNLDGKKLGGKKWIGGNWTAAPYIARDAGENAVPEHLAYVASVWETGKQSGILELRVTAITNGKDIPVILHVLGATGSAGTDASKAANISGLAVHNGIVYVSLPQKNEIISIDARSGKVIGNIPLESPKGLAFNAQGRLLALSATNLLLYNSFQDPLKAAPQKTLINNLLAPIAVAVDGQGHLYVSDRGTSHQVKVYSPEGKFIRAIGKPGIPKAGPYDPLHMNNPSGLTIDSRNQLWVAEEDYLPKRISVWTPDGKFIKAFYGPGKYGGGGTLDPVDKDKFYYADEGRGAMEFKLDWEKGSYQLTSVYYRPSETSLKMAFRSGGPETPLYYNGKRYYTNSYNSSPTNGHSTSFLFIERDGIACPVAAMGQAFYWDILKTDPFKKNWPEGVDLGLTSATKDALFIWSDKNEDAQVQVNEVKFKKGGGSGVVVMPDLSFCIARVGDMAMQFFPDFSSGNGVPDYNFDNGKILAEGVFPPASSGGNQVLAAPDDLAITSLGMAPFSRFSISGAHNGIAKWSYPNMWPGLHASHKAPKPEFRGEIIGPTRLLGSFIEPKGSDIGKVMAINGNHGNIYLFSYDGLFVATLFNDMRLAPRWTMPFAIREMRLDTITLNDENFWPSITQTPDGKVYLVDGGRSAIVRLDSIENIQRLPEMSVSIHSDQLESCRVYLLGKEEIRQKNLGDKTGQVIIQRTAPIVDGKLDEWTADGWVDIDKSGVKAYFNANTKPYDITGAMRVSGNMLYIAYRTGDPKLLQNSGEMPVAPFKTGGALDLMIGADLKADPGRKSPVEGDRRLLVTMVDGKPYAMLYQAVVKGVADAERIPFSSPSRSITFDKVDNVTEQIRLAGSEGNYEVSVPLSLLGLTATNGLTIKGDLGILRGDGSQTTARTYWSNKATGITADVPSEAMLTPSLWGTLKFITE